MSFYLRKVSIVLFANLLLAVTAIPAQEWVRGAVAVVSVKGEVAFEEIGGETLQMDSADSVPRYLSGFLKVRTQIGDSVFLRTSNQISIYNQGVGELTIERFEQDVEAIVGGGADREDLETSGFQRPSHIFIRVASLGEVALAHCHDHRPFQEAGVEPFELGHQRIEVGHRVSIGIRVHAQHVEEHLGSLHVLQKTQA